MCLFFLNYVSTWLHTLKRQKQTIVCFFKPVEKKQIPSAMMEVEKDAENVALF